jgi:phage/plasmid-like protein (TIGR03299 family)
MKGSNLMAHQIEQFEDGTAAFFSAREDAWHRLGTVTSDCLKAEDVMTTAYLGGWNVRKIGLTATELTEHGVTSIPLPDKFATVRTHPKTGETDYLGVVGSDYVPFQNEACCDLLNTLVDESGAHFETAGSLREGRQTFVTMKLPKAMTVAGVDDIDLYLAVTNSHDGSSALRVDATPIRIVCKNTQRAALKASRASYKFRHTSGAKGRVAEAREALGLMWTYFEEFEKAAERMLTEAMTVGEFERITEKLWPLAPNPAPRTKNTHTKRTSALRGLFRDAATNANIRGTRWAGYQAITEYLDHVAPAKSDEVRANRVLTSGTVHDVKEKAFALLAV